MPVVEGDLVRDAIRGAEEVLGPLDDVVKQSASDPGAPFTPENLDRITQLSQDDPAAFERLRAKLKEAGIRVPQLDKAIQRQASNDKALTTGAGLGLREDEPWPYPVDGGELLNEIVAAMRKFLVLPVHADVAMALWVIFAHALEAFFISPRLALVSPEKRCGKTTTLSVIQELVPKPLPAANITAAALFRTIEMATPTMLIDEADTFLKYNDELRGVLNSGHNRGQAYVVRTTGDEHIPRKFCTWAPVVIAMIGGLPDTLSDRSIIVKLKRKRSEETTESLRFDRVEEFEPLRQKIARWVNDNMPILSQWDGDVPQSLHDRAADNWRPLLAIADSAGGDWPEKAGQAATALTDVDDESSIAGLLLGDIKALFDESGTDRLPTQTILDKLTEMDGRPWPEFRRGKPLSSRQLSSLVKPFGTNSKSIRFPSGENAKGFMRKDFEDAFARYLPDENVTPSQAPKTEGISLDESVTNHRSVTDSQRANAAGSGTRDGVTDKDPGEWEVVL